MSSRNESYGRNTSRSCPNSSIASEEQIQELEERYNAIPAKRKEEICPRCRQPKTREAWTRVTMPDMAKKSDSGLAEICISGYLEPAFHFTRTAYGLGTRLRDS